MKSFLTRIISIAAVVAIIIAYDNVVHERDAEEAELLAQYKEAMAAENGGSGYADGTYTGEAQGFGGPVSMEVVIEDGKITEVNILSAEKEDGAYLRMAEDIIPAIIEAQSAEVDTVSGATFSSTGIRDAVAIALEKAKE